MATAIGTIQEGANRVIKAGTSTWVNAVQLVGPTGLPISFITYAEDSVHVSGDYGIQMLGVSNQTLATFAADGDYTPVATDTKGRVLCAVGATGTLLDNNGNGFLSSTSATGNAHPLGVGIMGWDGLQALRLRTANVFKVIALTAATAETTIWTPAGGKKFRLMGFLLTSGAGSTLTFKDNTAGTTIFASRALTDYPYTPNLGNGILSAAANNVLTVTRGTSSTLDGVVWGTEE